jgi:hypothetical protein
VEDADCTPAGVPSDGCAAGFEWSDQGCRVLLPTLPCPAGTMALPGDSACRAIVDCGAAPWGDIVVGADTQYVDGSFVGSSDGSASQPWTTVAAGDYAETVTFADRAVTLWGRCPEQTHLTAGADTAITVPLSASGSTIRGLRIDGDRRAIDVPEGGELTVRDLWLRADNSALRFIASAAPGTLTGQRLLVDEVTGRGVRLEGVTAELSEVMVVGATGSTNARGIMVNPNNAGDRSSLTLSRAVLRNHETAGIQIFGSDAEISETAVAAPGLPSPRAIAVLDEEGVPSNLVLRDSVLEEVVDWPLRLRGSSAVLERVTARNSQNVGIYCLPPSVGLGDPTLEVHQSLVEHAQGTGIMSLSCDVTVHATVVRDTTPLPGQTTGHGIAVGSMLNMLPVAHHDVAIDLRDSVVERATLGGVTLVAGVTGTVSHTRIAETRAIDGLYGDGFTVVAFGLGELKQPDLRVERSVVRDNARTGLALFGAKVTISDSRLLCNPIDLASQDASLLGDVVPHELTVEGDNRCGCDEVEACRNQNVDVGPPPLPFGP